MYKLIKICKIVIQYKFLEWWLQDTYQCIEGIMCLSWRLLQYYGTGGTQEENAWMWVTYWHDVPESQMQVAALGCVLLGFAPE
jgi:hypothetical protein